MLPSVVDDYRALARTRLPRQLFEFIDGGSFAEETVASNRSDFARLRLRQRVLRPVGEIDLSTTVLGERWALPVGLGPVGLAGLMRRRGELQALRAAQDAGTQFCLSTVALCPLEEVAAASQRPFWFQLYIMKDRGFARELIARAKAAGCKALVLTVDLAVAGLRHRDVQTGMTGGLGWGGRARVAADYARRWDWLWDVGVKGRPHLFGNLVSAVPNARRLSDFYQFTSANWDPCVSWADIEWIRAEWGGPLVIKGILDPEDAVQAVKAGAQALVVSNHGGRQLDGVGSTISCLPGIVQAVGGDAEVLLDGGVRNGIDVLRAVALGARACLVGRPWIWALAARGQDGVAGLLATYKRELQVSLALAGLTRIADVDRNALASVGTP
ncbi:alpha-hydroxy-acid oxidizing enzyme [Ramlibacter sp. Leaf400]|nr:alpha-hydroxy-acid oxidizing enzyme [Ramlibacter sp. Leaf400]